jgi:ABC-type Fe3+ transport system permease subunit
VELLEILIGLLDLLCAACDVMSWIKSAANRRERREARRTGARPPPRTGWLKAFWVLTVVVILLTALLVCRVLR